MTPSTVSAAVVSERIAWVEAMLAGIRALPLASLDEFGTDTRTPAAAESYLRRALEGLMDLRHHPLRPFIFETWVASELAKAHYHAGDTPVLSFFRDARGREVDIVEDRGDGFLATEAKRAPQPRANRGFRRAADRS